MHVCVTESILNLAVYVTTATKHESSAELLQTYGLMQKDGKLRLVGQYYHCGNSPAATL